MRTGMPVSRGRALAGLVEARVAQIVAFRHVENEMNGVDRHDGCSSMAPVTPPVTRLPASTFLSEMRPEMGARTSAHSRFSSAALRLARLAASCASATLEVDLRCSNTWSDRTFVLASGSARSTSERASSSWACSRVMSALGGLDGDFERTLVDGEQQIALFHQRAVGEVHLVDEARHARAHLDAVHRFQPAPELVPGSDFLGQRRCHGHRKRWRCRLSECESRRECQSSGERPGRHQTSDHHAFRISGQIWLGLRLIQAPYGRTANGSRI